MDFLGQNKKAEAIAKQYIKREEVPLGKTTHDHKHEWELLSKTYAPPRQDLTYNTSDKEIIDRALFGVTVFLWECLICKVLRKEQVLGSDTTQLDEMVDKADKYGPQYIQRIDGTTFILAKQLPSTLPVR